jgi:hypothetical protein
MQKTPRPKPTSFMGIPFGPDAKPKQRKKRKKAGKQKTFSPAGVGVIVAGGRRKVGDSKAVYRKRGSFKKK